MGAFLKTTLVVAAVAAGLHTHCPALAQQSGADRRTASAPAKNDTGSDFVFAKKAYEGGQAEIELGQLAREKGHAETVKAYGARMVEEHTEANRMLMSLFQARAQAAVVDGTSTVSGGNTGKSNPAGGMATGTGTGTERGSATGATDAPAEGSGTVPPTDSANASGTNLGTTSVAGAGSALDPRNEPARGLSGSGRTDEKTQAETQTETRDAVPAFSSALSSEHRALKAKLSKLSGMAFDRAYLQAMVDDHTRMLTLVNTYAEAATESPGRQWAQQHRDIIRQHRERAQELLQSLR